MEERMRRLAATCVERKYRHPDRLENLYVSPRLWRKLRGHNRPDPEGTWTTMADTHRVVKDDGLTGMKYEFREPGRFLGDEVTVA